MSFFSQTSAATARSRRTKERDGHPRASSMSTSGRRHRTSSKSQENRTSPPSKSPQLSASGLYAQQNVGLDHLPPLPPSEAPTPAFTSPTSSIHQAQPSTARSPAIIHLNQQVYTPLNLQQYLDNGEDESEETSSEEGTGDEEQSNDETELSSAATVQHGQSSIPPKDATMSLLSREISAGGSTDEAVKSQQPVSSPQRASDDDTPRADQQVDRTVYFDSTSGGELYSQQQQPQQQQHQQQQQQASARITRRNSEDASKYLDNAGKHRTEDTVPPMTQSAAEYYYKSSNTAPVQTPPMRAAGLRRSRPFSQIVSSQDLRELPQDLPEQPTMTRTLSQQSGPILTRAFTPPAPPVGASRAPAQTPPVYMSPVPVRSRLTGEGYGGYYPPSPYHAMRQGTQPAQSDQYHVPGAYQNHPEPNPSGYAVPQSSFSQLSGTPHSSNAEVKKVGGYSTGEQDDPLALLSRLHTALPHIQMLLAHSQMNSGDGASISNDLISLRTAAAEELEDQKTKHQLLEIKHLEAEQKHTQEMQVLLVQIAELQAKVKYLEDDNTHQRQSRDKMHEDLVMERMEASMTVKSLIDEREDLRRKLDQVKLNTEQDIQDKVKALNDEIALKAKTAEDLKSHATQIQALHLAQLTSTKQHHETEYNHLLDKHKQTAADLQQQLKDQQEKSKALAKQVEETPYRINEERARLSERFNTDISDMKKAHQAKIEALEDALRSEKHSRNNLLEELSNLDKQLDAAKSHAANHKARYIKAAGDFRSAATKMNQENVNLQKMIEAFSDSSESKSRGPSPTLK